MIKDLQNLVNKFIEKEEITLKQALLQASLGMGAKSGDIAEVVRGVVFNGYPYTEERKKQNAEHLGELLFYWVMAASTCDVDPELIIDQYIAAYIARNKIMKEDELRASIVELLKHVKTPEIEKKREEKIYGK